MHYQHSPDLHLFPYKPGPAAFEVYTGAILNFINLDTYGISGKTHKNIAFSVLTCQDARIALAPTTDFTSLMYDVGLAVWRNTRSVIRTVFGDDNKNAALNNESNIVNCTEFRDFWVSWTDNHIKSGKGLVVGQDILVSYDDSHSPKYEVNFIGISTGWGAPGTWVIYGN